MLEKTGYPDETFDLITGFQTHFHWEDIETSFTELGVKKSSYIRWTAFC